jgi:hypothetical protein
MILKRSRLKLKKFKKVLEEIGSKIYQQAASEQQGSEAGQAQPDDVVDADFTAEDKDK